jgi:peptidoglycan/LPS O-acetylase OafA/YrhL
MLQLLGYAALLGPAWTLSIEWLFYGQQVATKALRVLDRAWMLGFGWLGLYCAMNVAERILDRDLPTTLPMLLATSCLGQAVHLAHAGFIKCSGMATLAASCIVLIPVGAYVGLDADKQWPALNYAISFIGGLELFAAAYCMRRRTGPRVLLWLGAVSYSMYLVHPLIMNATARWFPGLPVVVVAANVLLIPLASWLGYRAIEVPFQSLGRRMTSIPSAPPKAEREAQPQPS